MRQRRSRSRLNLRAQNIQQIANHLERTTWGRGIYIPGMVVPAARPAQIKAGARKLYDVIAAQVRREQKQAVQG